MNTTTATQNYASTSVNKSAYSKLVDLADTNRHGLIAMLLLVIGCLGGITVGMGGIEYDFALLPVIASTMLALSMILAVAPMKYVLGTSIAAFIIDIVVLISLAII
jgi:predicted histidine transporter YuiF (NhaC family)